MQKNQNRYERLFGFHFRKLIDDLTKNLGGKKSENIVTSILLYKSYNDSFYYVGLAPNPLISPSEISQAVNLPTFSVLTPKTLWHLGSYLCSELGKTQIIDVFDGSQRLVRSNASTFDLTYSSFQGLKDEWSSWLESHQRDNTFLNLPTTFDGYNLLLNEVWLLGNFLLTLMPISGLHEGSSAAEIFHIVMGIKGYKKKSGWINKNTGEFDVEPSKPYHWQYQATTNKTYGQLLDLIEFLYMVPASLQDKENTLEKMYSLSFSNDQMPQFKPPDINLTALATPLFHDNEFQGIIYTSRKFGESGFNKKDRITFRENIKFLNICNLLADARFDLGHLSILHNNAEDVHSSPLQEILDRINVFSSAHAGILVIENEEVLSFKREKKPTGIGCIMVSAAQTNGLQIRQLIKNRDPKDLQTRRAIWLLSEDKEFYTFLNLIATKDRVGSICIMAFPNNPNSSNYIILFFGEREKVLQSWHKEWWPSEKNYTDIKHILTSASSKIHFEIEKLMDSYSERHSLLRLERRAAQIAVQGLPLITSHYIKNVLRPYLVSPLKRAIEHGIDGITQEYIKPAAEFAERFASQSEEVSNAWKNVLQNKPGIVTSVDFQSLSHELCSELALPAEYFNIKIESTDDVCIKTSKEILRFVLEQLLLNAKECPMDSSFENNVKSYELKWKTIQVENEESKRIVEISVWNSGTSIDETTIKEAGKGALENVPQGHTGLGLYLVCIILSLLNAEKYEDGRFFMINETTNPLSVCIMFSFQGFLRSNEDEQA